MTLQVTIVSFSYKRGLPPVDPNHGGGFLFDCRCLPNPGREAYYKDKTGLDSEVIAYLKEQPMVERFAAAISGVLSLAIESYLERDFSLLEVGFGCTGGQHRSVYFSEWCSAYIKGAFNDVETSVYHQGLHELGYLKG
jgi:RNase adaptor protein for sRNA GlmZ degradation